MQKWLLKIFQHRASPWTAVRLHGLCCLSAVSFCKQQRLQCARSYESSVLLVIYTKDAAGADPWVGEGGASSGSPGWKTLIGVFFPSRRSVAEVPEKLMIFYKLYYNDVIIAGSFVQWWEAWRPSEPIKPPGFATAEVTFLSNVCEIVSNIVANEASFCCIYAKYGHLCCSVTALRIYNRFI